MVSYGPWRDDSLPVWRDTGLANSASHFRATTYISDAAAGSVQSSYGPVMEAAWGGTGSSFGTGGGRVLGPNWLDTASSPEMTAQGNARAVWTHTWVTVIREDIGPVTTGVLPGPPDPEAVGVEWEPTSTPVDQKLDVTLGLPGRVPVVFASEPITVKLGQANPVGSYDPGFLTAAAVRARATLATFDGVTDGGVTLTDLPIDLTGPASLALTLLDSFTNSGTYFPIGTEGADSPTQRRYLPFGVTLSAAYTPRYRYVYADVGRMPPLRQVQRPSVPRAVQNNSRQASLRSGRAFI